MNFANKTKTNEFEFVVLSLILPGYIVLAFHFILYLMLSVLKIQPFLQMEMGDMKRDQFALY